LWDWRTGKGSQTAIELDDEPKAMGVQPFTSNVALSFRSALALADVRGAGVVSRISHPSVYQSQAIVARDFGVFLTSAMDNATGVQCYSNPQLRDMHRLASESNVHSLGTVS
jgi:hypothetical protein